MSGSDCVSIPCKTRELGRVGKATRGRKININQEVFGSVNFPFPSLLKHDLSKTFYILLYYYGLCVFGY